MCLITLKRSYKIAKKDMVVWKQLNDDFTSLTQAFPYKPNILYKQPLELIDKVKYNELNKIGSTIRPADGTDATHLHDKYDWWGGADYDSRLIYIRKGFHSYVSTKRLIISAASRSETISVRFMIPKGSRYILDDTGLCVSNKIIMI